MEYENRDDLEVEPIRRGEGIILNVPSFDIKPAKVKEVYSREREKARNFKRGKKCARLRGTGEKTLIFFRFRENHLELKGEALRLAWNKYIVENYPEKNPDQKEYHPWKYETIGGMMKAYDRMENPVPKWSVEYPLPETESESEIESDS